MRSEAASVEEYLAGLAAERRDALAAVRRVILKHLPRGYAEGMQYGMIGYFVPHAIYPAGYHCDPAQPLPFAGLASQKHYMALYLSCLYSDAGALEAFCAAWKQTGRRLDMGKSCVRFRRLEDVPLAVVGRAIGATPVDKFIAAYEGALAARRSGGRSGRNKRAPGSAGG